MPKTVAVALPKGGGGKTTVTLSLASGLTLRGYKTLSVDLDRQGNFSFSAGVNRDGATVLGVLTREIPAAAAIQHTEEFGDVLPSSKLLVGADKFLTGVGSEYRLKERLEPIAGDYDYIILDTPPAIGALLINALTACNSVVVPVQADIWSLQGIEELWENFQPVKQYCNTGLTFEGIVLTRFSPRSIISRDVEELTEMYAAKLGTKLFKARIREAAAVRESQLKQISIFAHAPRSKVTGDFNNLIDEFLKGES